MPDLYYYFMYRLRSFWTLTLYFSIHPEENSPVILREPFGILRTTKGFHWKEECQYPELTLNAYIISLIQVL